MSTFFVVYILSLFVVLAVSRFMLHTNEWKPGPHIMLMVFIPVANTVAAIVFIIVGIIMLLYWIANGTLEL